MKAQNMSSKDHTYTGNKKQNQNQSKQLPVFK